MSSNWGYLTMRFLHTNLMYRILLEQTDGNLYQHRAPWWHCVPLMQLLEQRTKLQCVPLMSSRSRYSGFLQEFLHPTCDWIQGLKALIYSVFFLITSQRSCNNCVHFDILTNGPHLCTTGTFMVLGRAFFVLGKYKNSVGIFAKFPLLRQLDQLRFFQLAISWSWITVGHLI